ncbi:MAG: hypothetical protein M1821_009835 [Bathelium mastoideum]|nr:MAG: hypothetical protein M1821_009835 [Bathelium mastoideum]
MLNSQTEQEQYRKDIIVKDQVLTTKINLAEIESRDSRLSYKYCQASRVRVRLMDGLDFFLGLTATGSAHWMLVVREVLSFGSDDSDEVEPDRGIDVEVSRSDGGDVGELTVLEMKRDFDPTMFAVVVDKEEDWLGEVARLVDEINETAAQTR